MEFEEQINKPWKIPAGEWPKGYCGVSAGINKLVLHPNPHHALCAPSASTQLKGGGVMQVVSGRSWLLSRHTRQLVSEAMSTFRNLQTAKGEQEDLTPLLVKASREYRSMLQACVCSINSFLDQQDPNSDIYQQLAEQCELLYKMELLLGLTEVIFVDARPGSLILSQLVCWVRLHYPGCADQMTLVMQSESPDQHQLYWEAVYGLTCQGRLSDARQLLQQHPHSHTEPFSAIEELLRKMPTYQVYSGVSEGEFMLRWEHWQTECQNRLQRGEFTAWSHLRKLAQVLCGDQSTILSCVRASSGSSCWVPQLVATLLYTQPNIKLYRLHTAATQAIAATGDTLSVLDSLLLSAMEGDARQVVRGCQQSLDNLWLSAHLTDLLHHATSAHNNSYQLTALRDSVVLDYALELVDHDSLWQVGIVYLDYCGGAGEASPLTPLLLERVPLTSDAKAHKVINMAAERSLDHVVSGVCRVMGRRAGSEGRLAAAIWWGVRARDERFTTHTAHQVLHRYLSSGNFESSALLLDHLGPSMLLSDTLTFLGKYREFHALYQQGDYHKAADLLVTLIASKLAPQYFWPILLLDALPLLQQSQDSNCVKSDISCQGDTVVVTAAHTYELMYCLNTVMEQCAEKDIQKTTHGSNESNSVGVAGEVTPAGGCSGLLNAFLQREPELRSCLNENLARAIVEEGSAPTMGA